MSHKHTKMALAVNVDPCIAIFETSVTIELAHEF